MVDYKTGDRVRITGGQYRGMIGKLRGISKDSGRCTVELDAGSDPSLLDNCYFTSVVEIEPVPDDVLTKPVPKTFPDAKIDELAAQAKELAKNQPKAEPKRPMFARRNKHHEEKHEDESMNFDDIFVDDFAAASIDDKAIITPPDAPKEFNPEEFQPKAFEPIPAEEPVAAVPEQPPVQEQSPVQEAPTIIPNPIPSSESQPAEPDTIPNPIPSQEQPKVARMAAETSNPEQYKHEESQPKEMQEKTMDNQEFVPKFRQEVPKPQEFIPLPCRNCRLKDQRENCSPKEFSECQAAYAFDEYLKEHSVQLFVEQILIPEMNQVGVTEPEKKAMLQRLLLEL